MVDRDRRRGRHGDRVDARERERAQINADEDIVGRVRGLAQDVEDIREARAVGQVDRQRDRDGDGVAELVLDAARVGHDDARESRRAADVVGREGERHIRRLEGEPRAETERLAVGAAVEEAVVGIDRVAVGDGAAADREARLEDL
jgi:hypothetical protein